MLNNLITYAAISLVAGSLMADQAAPGSTRIAQWKDDKKAPFMMMFDDCCPTHVTNVHPALQQRGMVGTYYIVGNKPERKARVAFWEQEAPAAANVVYANHTMNHKALTSAGAEQEILECNELIYRVQPGKKPRLISYASPGGAKHEVTPEQLNAILAKNNLIVRPTFQNHGGGVHFKTGADVLTAADKAAVSGEPEYVIFHGVGGDWISFDQQEFLAMLDGLDKRRDTLWITDPISVHKYETERKAALIETAQADDKKVILNLKSTTDAALYDQPLTLVTKVPAGWKRCTVTQNGNTTKATVTNGEAKFEVQPTTSAIQLESI